MTSRYLPPEAWPRGRRTTPPAFLLPGQLQTQFRLPLQAPQHPRRHRENPLGNTKAGASFNVRRSGHAFEKPSQSSAVTPHSRRKMWATFHHGILNKWRQEAAQDLTRTPSSARSVLGTWLLHLAVLTSLPPSLGSASLAASTGRPRAPAVNLHPRHNTQSRSAVPRRLPGIPWPHLRSARGAAETYGRLAAAPASACKCSSRRRPRGPGPPPPSPRPGRRPCCRRGWGAAFALAQEAPEPADPRANRARARGEKRK